MEGEACFQGSRLCELNTLLWWGCGASTLVSPGSEYEPIQSLYGEELIILSLLAKNQLKAPGWSYHCFSSGISFQQGTVFPGCILAFPAGWPVIYLECHKILLRSLFSEVSDHLLQWQSQQEEFTAVVGKPRLTKAHRIPVGASPGPYWVWELASILCFA